MRDLLETYKIPNDKPWLIVGMGPTFSRRDEFDLTKYNVFGINRVVRDIPCELVSIIDYYILALIYDKFMEQGKYLVMPYQPHFGYRPSPVLNVHNLAMYRPNLLKISALDKLLCYNLSTYPFSFGKSPIIRAQYFSAEAAFSILANMGQKHIYTLGVDGGNTRADEFKDHGPTDPRGFDIQWKGINRTCKMFDMIYTPLIGDSNEKKALNGNGKKYKNRESRATSS